MYKSFFRSLLREPLAWPGGSAYSRPEQEPTWLITNKIVFNQEVFFIKTMRSTNTTSSHLVAVMLLRHTVQSKINMDVRWYTKVPSDDVTVTVYS